MKDSVVSAGIIIFAAALAVRLVLFLCDDGSPLGAHASVPAEPGLDL